MIKFCLSLLHPRSFGGSAVAEYLFGSVAVADPMSILRKIRVGTTSSRESD